MKSSSGEHYPALDHVRALAAFLVVAWHFTHRNTGYPVPFEGAPLLPFAIFDEGHTGVALFMALSGYLFAKLIGDKRISYPAFVMNRALRLLPLLAFVVAVVGVQKYLEGADMAAYARRIIGGAILPSLPNGGWSITAEAHFYILLPLLLLAARRSRLLIAALVAAAVALRLIMWGALGSVQELAYSTIAGRFDQFALGILFFHLRRMVADRHAIAAAVGAAFLSFYWLFDVAGGFMQIGGRPSPSLLWVILPTIEGAAYAFLIAWYDNSFAPRPNWVSAKLARVGDLSYSIYLLHFFFVFHAADFVHRHIMDISNFYVALAWAAVFFWMMCLPASLTFKYIEEPANRMKRPYVIPEPAAEVTLPAVST